MQNFSYRLVIKSASRTGEFGIQRIIKKLVNAMRSQHRSLAALLLDRNDIAFTVLRSGCRDRIESRIRVLDEYSTSRNAHVPVVRSGEAPLLLPLDVSLSFRESLEHRGELQIIIVG